jgi:hypothetical protein
LRTTPQEPDVTVREVIPEGKRPAREEMIHTAHYYFAGLQRNDGKGYYPFTDDCDRFENGIQTTNIPQRDRATGQTVKRGCKKQFEESLKGAVSRVRDRRFVAVDRERGIVFAFVFFDHVNINWTWQMAELFKIENGQIRRIKAVFQRAPYGINSGWSTYEQGISEEPRSSAEEVHRTDRAARCHRPYHLRLKLAATDQRFENRDGQRSSMPANSKSFETQLVPPLPLSGLSIPTTSVMFYAADISRAGLLSSESPLAPPALSSLLPLCPDCFIFVPWYERG